MPGKASGVCLAALWNRTMDPACTTRWVISGAERSFQSRESTSETSSRRWGEWIRGSTALNFQPRDSRGGVKQDGKTIGENVLGAPTIEENKSNKNIYLILKIRYI